jgi:hypothetical protein
MIRTAKYNLYYGVVQYHDNCQKFVLEAIEIYPTFILEKLKSTFKHAMEYKGTDISLKEA